MTDSGNLNFKFTPTPAILNGEKGLTQVVIVSWRDIPGGVTLSPSDKSGCGTIFEETKIKPNKNNRGECLISVSKPESARPGEKYHVKLSLNDDSDVTEREFDCIWPHDDWKLFIGAGYHVDPVWWNTQRDYTEVGSRQGTGVNTFLELNRQYLELLKTVPEFKCTIETIPATHPTWLVNPELRSFIREMVESGRLELIASHDQPQTTLTGFELICRNILYGIGFGKYVSDRKLTGLAPWDVFGHDTAWISAGKHAGLEWNVFCRGLYHGDHLPAEENLFPSEFRWITPDGTEFLTHYMSRHYTSGWEFSWKSMDEGEIPVLDRFRQLAITASTRNTLLPCYGDFAEPFEGMIEFVRSWNEKYYSPKIHYGTQEDYLREVDISIKAESGWLPPISRDMNPAFAGCNMSYAGTKVAQRVCENLVRDAEIWAAAALLHGAEYPVAAFDRIWRILCFTSHHDAVTGSESDQVYLDLIAMWREAFDLATELDKRARESLAELTSPSTPGTITISVFNSLNWATSGTVSVDIPDTTRDTCLDAVDEEGNNFPLIESNGRFTFHAKDVPSLGWKNYSLSETGPSSVNIINSTGGHSVIHNDCFQLEFDMDDSGNISSLLDLRSGREFLSDGCGGNKIAVHDEYPGMNMAPWIIQPTGKIVKLEGDTTEFHKTRSPICQSVRSKVEFESCVVERRVSLSSNASFIDCETTIHGYADRDTMWRVEFPVNLPGCVPVAQTGGGVIGRNFGRWGDFQDDKYFGNWPVDMWGGLEAPLTFRLKLTNGTYLYRTVAVCEIVIPDEPSDFIKSSVDWLVPILAKAGVTSVVTRDSGRRSGDWLKDGSRPDFRIALGSESGYYKKAFELTDHIGGPENTVWLDSGTAEHGPDLPVILFPANPAALNKLLDSWQTAVNSPPALLEINWFSPASKKPEREYMREAPCAGFAILVNGTPDMHILPDGTISLGLFRSSSARPSGGWVDGQENAKRLPDNSYFQHMHWSHTFRYRLMPFEGDWRDSGVYRQALEFNHPLKAVASPENKSGLTSSGKFLNINTDAFVQAITPFSHPENQFDQFNKKTVPDDGLTVRLREIEGKTTSFDFGNSMFIKTDLTGVETKSIQNGSVGPWSIASFRLEPEIQDLKILAGNNPYSDLTPDYLLPSRYWRSNHGPCGWASQPIFHRFIESSVKFENSESVTAHLLVVNNTAASLNEIDLSFSFPDSLEISDWNETKISLAPGEFRKIPVRIKCTGDIHPNGGYISATIHDPAGVKYIASVPLNRAKDQHAPVRIHVPRSVFVNDGGTAFDVEIENLLDQEIDGFVEMILPFSGWHLIDRSQFRRKVSVGSLGRAVVSYRLGGSSLPAHGQYFGIIKVHMLEEQEYSDTFWIITSDQMQDIAEEKSGYWMIPDDEIRLTPKKSVGLRLYSHDTHFPVCDAADVRTEKIPGGYERSYRFRLGPEQDSFRPPREISEGSRNIGWTITHPSGPSIKSNMVLNDLQIKDDPEKWNNKLTKNEVHLYLQETERNETDPLEVPVHTGYDSHAIYFMIEIPWPIRCNPHKGRKLLESDCLHLAFFPNRQSELAFALTEGGETSWTFNEIMDAPRPKSPEVKIIRSDSSTVFMTKIDWKYIYLDRPPETLPWSVAIHRCDHGGLPEQTWSMTDGFLDRKTADGREFGLLELIKP